MSEVFLQFVYNANSDVKSKTIDFLHKAISPGTYNCELCSITHSNFGERSEWRVFLDNLPVKSMFTYKNIFLEDNPNFKGSRFPIALFKDEVILSKTDFDQLDLAGLKSIILEKTSE